MRRISVILTLLALAACASTPQSNLFLKSSATSAFPDSVVLSDVPFFPQEEFRCGPAALATVLQFDRVVVTPDELVPQVYLPARQGSLQIEMLAATRRYGRIAYVLPPSLVSVLKEVQQGRPVLVMQNLGVEWYPRWHYAVVLGYDIDRAELILNTGITEHYHVSLALFERTWQRANHWAMVVLSPGDIPVDADELVYLEALTALEATPQLAALPGANIEAGYTAGIQRWPSSTVLVMGLGNLYYQQGRKQQAAEQFLTAIDRDPGYAPAYNNLAQVLLELGDWDNALVYAHTAVTLGGAHFEIFQATLENVRSTVQ